MLNASVDTSYFQEGESMHCNETLRRKEGTGKGLLILPAAAAADSAKETTFEKST